MSTSISFKAFALFFILIVSGKISYSQTKTTEQNTKLILPESYYRGQEEKRKYAEAQKQAAAQTMTLTTIQQAPVAKKESINPELRAKSMLNTSNVPSDFPKYNPTMTEKEYEGNVYKWFKANPTFRKNNN